MCLISVITPTYNRSHLLNKLYESLENQTSNNFEWIVVDDGSSDDTNDVIDKFIKKNKVNIVYLNKRNGGKHTAVNFGIKKAKGKLIFIVDSDDYLTSDAIESIEIYHEKYKNNKKICGYSFLRGFPNGNVNGMEYSSNEFISNYNSYRIEKKIIGDKAEVYYKDIFEQFLFPEIKDEKFISEDVSWINMANLYDTVYINKIIYIGEYLDGGLTANDKKIKFNSPKGSALRGLTFMRGNLRFLYKLKGAIIYNAYIIETNDDEFINPKNLGEKILISITRPLGIYFNKKWKNEMEQKKVKK